MSRVTDGEWLEASEEELILVTPHEETENYAQSVDMLYLGKEIKKTELLPKMKKQNGSEKEEVRLTKEKHEIINGLLDVYNDYKFLYELFEDEEYAEVMNLVLKHLKKIAKSEQGK